MTHALTHFIHQATRMRVILLLRCPHELTHSPGSWAAHHGWHPLTPSLLCNEALAFSHTGPSLEHMPKQRLSLRGRQLYSFSSSYLAVSGVAPVVTNQTSWLESTDLCGVRQNQACGTLGITLIPGATESQYMQLLGA